MFLAGKVAIITGGGSGIGESAARIFSANGAKLIIADTNEVDGQRVEQEIRDASGQEDSAFFIHTDVSIEAQVQSLAIETVSKFGRIDVVLNNAATILPKPLEEVQAEEWNRLFDVNLKSVYLMIKHTIAYLRKTCGSIVNMASLNGLVGQKQNAAYAATKGGIVAMTKALALDYAIDGVRVNCICPAGVMTPLLEKWLRQQDDPVAARKALDAMHPLGRAASSEEIAKAALFLASDQGSFVTGIALPVEGGASLGY